MILLNLPTAYMTVPHCTIWRIMFSGLVFFSRCGVPLAGVGDTGPVAAADAARPAWAGAFGTADEAEASPDAPVTSVTVITPAVPHKRQCAGLRIVPSRLLLCRNCYAAFRHRRICLIGAWVLIFATVKGYHGGYAAWMADPGEEPTARLPRYEAPGQHGWTCDTLFAVCARRLCTSERYRTAASGWDGSPSDALGSAAGTS